MKPLTPNVTHGLASTYRNYGCRCDPCKAANIADLAKRRDGGQKRAAS